MNNIILFDTDLRETLLPFTFTRPVSELRLGILTIREKWQQIFPDATFSHVTSEYLEPLYPIRIEDTNVLINGGVLPSDELKRMIENLELNEALMLDDELIAAKLPRYQFDHLLSGTELEDLSGFSISEKALTAVTHLWDLPHLSAQQIGIDMQLMGLDPAAGQAYDVLGDYPVYIHPQANVERATLHAVDGPIYLGPHCLVMDGARLRGPVAVSEGSVVKMGANLYSGTCLGPQCSVGGEVKNSLFLGYANKAHEGYLGDSVIGAWCNLGALTTNSNLKNNFSPVRVYDYSAGKLVSSERMKCGVFIGDHTCTAIHTRLGAGTVIGVSCNVFGEGMPDKYLPSFTWGHRRGGDEYDFGRAYQAAARFRALKGHRATPLDAALLEAIFENTGEYRTLA